LGGGPVGIGGLVNKEIGKINVDESAPKTTI
jgi:hypothetical protein